MAVVLLLLLMCPISWSPGVVYTLQVMTSGQRVPFEFYGTNYVFAVNQALLEGQESSTPLDRGYLSSDTYIIFEAAPNSGIKVI